MASGVSTFCSISEVKVDSFNSSAEGASEEAGKALHQKFPVALKVAITVIISVWLERVKESSALSARRGITYEKEMGYPKRWTEGRK